MPSEHDPQAGVERRICARHLLQNPITCKENDPELFRLVRRHEGDLDRAFTQRLGYRLHVDADTARLYKVGAIPTERPLRTHTGRKFAPLEYTLLALVLGATAAGPAVISLRDLVEQIRSAAVEADIVLDDSPTTRRALVSALTFMIERGLATELHAGLEAYGADETADAVLRLRPDRIALVAVPALVGATSATELLERAERRSNTRQWMRCRLVEDPVLFRSDLSEAEWSELRRRLGEEERLVDEMFGLTLEARGEGVAAIDPAGDLATRPFPTGGTVGHAALLLLDALRDHGDAPIAHDEVLRAIEKLARRHTRGWSKDLVAAPDRLASRVIDLLVELRLAERVGAPATHSPAATTDPREATAESGATDATCVRLLPTAGRFLPAIDGEAAATRADARSARSARPTLF